MGSGSKAKKDGKIDMGNYIAKANEQEAYIWCIRNNILIAPEAKSQSEWYLVININGKKNRSPMTYEKVEIWKELYKFYLYYYEKYSGVEVEKKTEPKKFIKDEPVKQKEKQIINTLF